MTNLINTHPINRNSVVPPIIQRFCRLLVRLWGWKVDTWEIPRENGKVVALGVPHTANWDSIMMIVMVAAMGNRLRWLVKKELDLPVIGWLLRLTGGIFIERRGSLGVVDQVIEIINESDEIFLALAPEGTRSKVDRWKTGFYYIALGAEVPIALGYLDYGKKRGGIGKIIMPSGDIKADEPIFQEFYKDIQGRHPEKMGTIRLDPPARLSDPTRESA